MTLKELSVEAYRVASETGWHTNDTRSFGDITALLHSEVSEAFEEYRAGHKPGTVYFDYLTGYREVLGPEALQRAEKLAGEGNKPEGIGVELADVLIRIFDYAHTEGLDLDALVRIKQAYNETRPYRHGGKVV